MFNFFSFCSFIVCERPISFIFSIIKNKLISFVLTIIVHFLSILFVFSWCNVSEKIIYHYFFFSKDCSFIKKWLLVFFKIFWKICSFIKKGFSSLSILNRSFFFICFWKTIIFHFSEQSISFIHFLLSKIWFVQNNDAHLFPHDVTVTCKQIQYLSIFIVFLGDCN